MRIDWFIEFRRRVREWWVKRPLLIDRLEQLERSVSRLAREQAKANVELEESNQTQGQFIHEFGQGFRRLEAALHRRHQLDAAICGATGKESA